MDSKIEIVQGGRKMSCFYVQDTDAYVCMVKNTPETAVGAQISPNPIHFSAERPPVTMHAVTIFQNCPNKNDREWQQLTLGKWEDSERSARKLNFQPRSFIIPRGLGVVIETKLEVDLNLNHAESY